MPRRFAPPPTEVAVLPAAVPASRPPCVRRAAACLLLGLTAASAAAQGRIEFVDREGEIVRRTNVTITRETLDSVSFSEGQRDRQVDTVDVVSIDYGTGSRAFQRGKDALAAGDLDNAIALFDAARDEGDPPWVAPLATLRKAETELQAGRLDDAATTLDAFVREHGDHRLLPEALLLQARLGNTRRDVDAVDLAVESIVQLVDAGRVTPDWKPRALLERGDAELVTDSLDRARRTFERARDEADRARREVADSRPDLVPVVDALHLQARVGIGSVMLANDDLAGARAHFERLAREAEGDPAALVAAENGLAEADFREGGKLKQAQLGFARVALRAAGNPDEHARALYYLGRCAAELGEAGEEPGGVLKAQAYFEDVQKWYPNTRWARLAREARP